MTRRAWRVLRWWRRSLQVRVVGTTALLGLVVVAVVGSVMLTQVRDGLLDGRTSSALAEAERGTGEARRAFLNADYGDVEGLDDLLEQLVSQLESPDDDRSRQVLFLPVLPAQGEPEDGVAPGLSTVSTDTLSPAVVPAALRSQLAEDSDGTGSTQLRFTSARVEGADGGPVAALVAGSRIEAPLAGEYELFFVFPLDREEESLRLVQGTLLAGLAALVLLVGAVAFVVTRQVVDPVREAARIAEQLTSGGLDQRMQVRGDDDLARLGRSFNEMAGSLQRQIGQLEELSRLQRRFVSDVSHELRTPLTTVRMAGDVLFEARHDFPPAVARSAELLTDQLDRFETLLSDLLEISRFDAGAAVLDAEPEDLRDVVAGVVQGVEPLARARGSEVRMRLPGQPCIAEVDRRRVERVLRNLVANAVEHGEGRPIDIRIGTDAAAVSVTVRDHGVGLELDEAARVFDRFWRADPARARSTGGTGLGLAIALEDAHLHGGWLQAWGEPGRGTCFRLTVPRRLGGTLVSAPLSLVPDDALEHQR